MTNEIQTCCECRYYLPTDETHYNKQCGYCGNFRVQRRRVSDDKACSSFEHGAKNGNKKPDG